MKNYRVCSTFLLLFFFISQFAAAQVKNDVKSVLTNIIELSKAKKYEEAGKFIAFSNDKKKNYRIPVLTNKDQFNFVKRVVKKIGALSEVSSSYNLGAIIQSKENGFEFQSVTVEFTSGTQKISSLFKFVTIDGNLLLAEIE